MLEEELPLTLLKEPTEALVQQQLAIFRSIRTAQDPVAAALAAPELLDALNAELSVSKLRQKENLAPLTFNPGKRIQDTFHSQLVSSPLLDRFAARCGRPAFPWT